MNTPVQKSLPINYQPLGQMQKLKIGRMNVNLGYVTVISIILSIIFFSVQVQQSVIPYLVFISLGCISFVVFIISLILGYFQKNKAWEKFALANDWQIAPSGVGLGLVPPRFAEAGHSHKSSEVISGQINGLNFTVHQYQYTVGDGKNSHTYYYTIVNVILSWEMPNFDLRSRGKIDVEFDNPFDILRKLKLEGDFNKYFDLFVPKETEVDVLTVITPDIMQALKDNAQGISIQSQPKSLYIYRSGENRTVKLMPYLLENAAYIYGQFLENYRLSHP